MSLREDSGGRKRQPQPSPPHKAAVGTGLLESLSKLTRASKLCGCVGMVSLLYQEEQRGLGRAVLSWEGRQRTYGGPWGLCEWESSLWTLHPLPLLSLVKRGLNGSLSPSGLPLGTLRSVQGRA